MLVELLILGGLFLIFIGVVLLAIVNWLEARSLRKQSIRLEESFNRERKDG
tara:strand:+ start:1080 stop:1232 length:153 start_codon:yes stop_codon:yes gene_type:complete